MVKKTIAILGNSGKFPLEWMEVLMKQDLRLLFISEDEAKNVEVKNHLDKLNSVAEVEFSSCEREVCWEADIIAITHSNNISTDLIQRIKEVATQKIVLVISEINDLSEHHDLVELLPNSKVIETKLDLSAKEFSLTGNNIEAMAGIKSIFEKAGFKLIDKR